MSDYWKPACDFSKLVKVADFTEETMAQIEQDYEKIQKEADAYMFL